MIIISIKHNFTNKEIDIYRSQLDLVVSRQYTQSPSPDYSLLLSLYHNAID